MADGEAPQTLGATALKPPIVTVVDRHQIYFDGERRRLQLKVMFQRFIIFAQPFSRLYILSLCAHAAVC